MENLATEEDVTDILQLYHEYFDQDGEDEDEPPISDGSAAKQELNDCGGDFGMDLESTMTAVNLCISLGFKTGSPPLFNTYRHRSGISPWDDPEAFVPTGSTIPGELTKLCLHWHQFAGIHSIVRSVFSKEPNASHTSGVLVGDEVGLGKTGQAIGLIAFLNQTIVMQENKRPPPRILGE